VADGGGVSWGKGLDIGCGKLTLVTRADTRYVHGFVQHHLVGCFCLLRLAGVEMDSRVRPECRGGMRTICLAMMDG
jgi:hypothetical protein